MADVPPASVRSSRFSEAPDGQRHIVSVTFTMKMTNFAATPAYTIPIPQDTPDTTPPPLPPANNAAGDPNGQHTDTRAPAQPNQPPPSKPTPDPEPTAELILQKLLGTPKPVHTHKQPLAPLPQATEQLDRPAPLQPRLAQTDPQTDLIENLLPDISEQLEQVTEPQTHVADTDTNADDTDADTVTDADAAEDAKPAKPATDPSEPSQPTEPQPIASPAAAKVYDEDSVDQPIAFNIMKRPKATAVSKRLGEAGTVRILIEVDASGKLIRHQVIDDAGHARLLKAALAALKDSTFLPAQREDHPVRSTRIIEYRF